MGKRARGEGLLRQRKTGTKLWEARVLVPGAAPFSVYGRTQREAIDKRNAARDAVKASRPPDSIDWTVAQYLDMWLSDPSRNFRPATVARYESALALHINPHIGKVKLTDLSPLKCQEWLSILGKKRGLSAASVGSIRACLRNALADATRIELIPRNPVALTKIPPSKPNAIPPLTVARAREVLDAVEGSTMREVYHLALATGMRRGELLGLRWEDVSQDPPAVRVQYSLQWQGGEPVLATTKTRKGARIIPLFPPAVAALDRQRQRQTEWQAAAGARWRDTGLVFTTREGTALMPRYLTFDLTKHLKRAELPHMRFHDLRHGFATLLTAAGIHPRILMELMGHASIRIGQDRYAHVAPETLQDAMRQLPASVAAVFGGSVPLTVPPSGDGSEAPPRNDARDFVTGAGIMGE